MKVPNGNSLRAARSLIGWQQKQLAKRSGLDPATVHRMEKAGDKTVGGPIKNLEKVLNALEKAGVEITSDGVRLVPKK
jgi:transcriptional regulator with XRE-family HTH domain